MTSKIFCIGSTIVNILFRNKIKEDQRENFSDIISTLKELGLDEFEARQINRDFQQIADIISKSCKNLLTNSSVNQNRYEVLTTHILKAYENANIGNLRFFHSNMDQFAIKKELLNAYNDYKKDLNPTEIEIYERIIDHASNIMVNFFQSMPDYTVNGIKRLQAQMENIICKIESLTQSLDEINKLVNDKNKAIENFEREYRNSIVNKFSYINLFGATGLDLRLKKYLLSISYVELEFHKNDEEQEFNPKFLLNNNVKNIWIIGEAGSGKTTLLQWIAINVANNTSKILGTRTMIPLFVELRKMANDEISLKRCFDKTINNTSYLMPEGWIENEIASGRLLFLIDGFDEVDIEFRRKVFDWLDEIDPNSKCKKIFASRPQVKERPITRKIIEYRILPMGKNKIKQYINYWHKAVLEEQLEIDKNDSLSISFRLYEKIRISESLMKLASNPLLCAMICALHYRNGLNLPSNKREIYEECCKMLFQNRDMERNIIMSNFKLTYDQKKVILAQLAYWMMKNNYVEISKSQAESVVTRSIEGMSVEKNGSEILELLLERCGVLREPEVGKIDFIHRTFQEYLTANEITRNEDWGYLKEKIGEETWQETIILAIGYAKKEVANDIINTTLQKGFTFHNEKKYLFIAINYLSNSIEVDKQLRKNIEKQLSTAIPPKLEECIKLSSAGNLVVPYLAYNNGYDEDICLACLKTLRYIGTEPALKIVKTYFSHELSVSEIGEIGVLISQFSDKELIENNIPSIIIKYIKHICSETLLIHNSFIRAINLFNETINFESDLVDKIKTIRIVDYDGNNSFNFQHFFPYINKVMINGKFEKIDILKSFQVLNEIDLICEDDTFSIYNLNKYKNIYGIKKFKIALTHDEYVNGNELNFLRKCEDLANFYKLERLEQIEVGSAFVDEYDYRRSECGKLQTIKRCLLDDFYGKGFNSIPKYFYDYVFNHSYRNKKITCTFQ